MISKSDKNNKLSWVITIFIAILIFYFSNLSLGGVGGEGEGKSMLSVLYHISIFFFLSMFLFISLIREKKRKGLFFPGILVLLAYAVIDEMHQSFVAGRVCSVSDVLLDSTGILFAFMIYFVLLLYRKV